MIAQIEMGSRFASAQPSAAWQASSARPWPWVSAAKIQPISGSSANCGSRSRQALNRPTFPTRAPSLLRSTAQVPKPTSCQPPTAAEIRRQHSSIPRGLGPKCRCTSGCCMIASQGWKSALVQARRTSRSVSMVGAERINVPSCLELLLTEAESAEALVEARHLATGVEQLLVAAGPGRVDLGVDVEVHGVALFAPGRTCLELGPVGHFDSDHVVIGVGTGLHGVISS